MTAATRSKPIPFSPLMVRALLREAWEPGTGKTQTRRLVKPQPWWRDLNAHAGGWCYCNEKKKQGLYNWALTSNFAESLARFAPYQVGDRLWVKEALRGDGEPGRKRKGIVRYAADGAMVLVCATCGARRCECEKPGVQTDVLWSSCNWTRFQQPAMFMPRWASRLCITITDRRAERIRDIGEHDTLAEGIRRFTKDGNAVKFWPTDPVEEPIAGLETTWQDMPRDPRGAMRALWDFVHGAGAWERNEWVFAYTFTVEVHE